MNSPLLSPFSPSRLPATDKSWQGLPKVTMSTGSILLPSIFVISPSCLTRGKRLAVTARGNFSISLLQSVSMPHSDPAKGIVPAPSNKLPIVIAIVHLFRQNPIRDFNYHAPGANFIRCVA